MIVLKLSGEDTKKALECCTAERGIDCENCPAKDMVCDKVVLPSVIKYIQNLEDENTKLRKTINDIIDGLTAGMNFDKK